MGDGSHYATTANRALNTILGGEPQPVTDEICTPEQVLKRIMDCPLPEGPSPFTGDATEESYSKATDCIARAMLETTTDENRDEDYSEAWYRAKARWPNLDDWIGGASGFMVGFAWNTVRYIKGWGEVANPALCTIET